VEHLGFPDILYVNWYVLVVGSFVVLRCEGSHNTFFCYINLCMYAGSLDNVCGVCTCFLFLDHFYCI
jgi:hypothetical protein